MRRLNFGMRTTQLSRLTRETVLAELRRFNAQRSHQVSRWIRDHASVEVAMDQLEATYAELARARQPWSVEAAAAAHTAASTYLAGLTRAIKHTTATAYRAASNAGDMARQITTLSDAGDALAADKRSLVEAREILAQQLASANERSTREKDNLVGQLAASVLEVDELTRASQHWRAQSEEANRRVQAVHAELQSILASRTWRTFTGYRRLRRWLDGHRTAGALAQDRPASSADRGMRHE
jgi:hypothetical protein